MDHFKTDNDQERLMKSLYYYATLLFYKQEYDKAIIPATQSFEIAESKDNTIWKARIAMLLGDLFRNCHLFKDALKYWTIAAKGFKDAGIELNHKYILCDIAVEHLHLKDRKSFATLIDSVISTVSPADSGLLYYCTAPRFVDHVEYKEYSDALRYHALMKEFNKKYPLTYNIVCSAELDAHLGNYNEAFSQMKDAESYATDVIDSVNIYNAYSFIYELLKDYPKVARYNRLVIKGQNKELEKQLNQSIVVEQRNYYDKIAAQEKERAMWLRIWLTAGMVAAALAIAGGTYYHRMRMRLKDMRIEAQMGEILLLQSDVCAGQEQNADMHDRLKLIYRRQWATLNMLNKQLRGLEDSDSSRRRVLRQIESELERMAQPEQLEQLVKEIDSTFGGIIAAAQSDGAIRDDDFTLAALLLARMDTGTICRLTGMKQNTMYSRRRRLKERLEACGSQVAADILRQAAL